MQIINNKKMLSYKSEIIITVAIFQVWKIKQKMQRLDRLRNFIEKKFQNLDEKLLFTFDKLPSPSRKIIGAYLFSRIISQERKIVLSSLNK